MPRYFLTLRYQGTHFFGWQKQAGRPEVRTVHGVVEDALATLCRSDAAAVGLVGSGRTDTGVHALGQVAHAELPFVEAPSDFLHRLNSLLPWDVTCLGIAPVTEDAHARFAATERQYLYLATPDKPVFAAPLCARLPRLADLAVMNEAAQALLGQHDFTGFAKRADDPAEHYRCTVSEIAWQPLPYPDGPMAGLQVLAMRIRANRFLRGQVRAMAGALLQVGYGRRPASWIAEVLEARSTQLATAVAPAEGLYLEKVFYPEAIFRRGPASS